MTADQGGTAWIRNVRTLLADGRIAPTDVALQDGRIAEIGIAPASAGLDGGGLLLLPGIVDLHGDAFERQLMPRPGVRFPVDLALLETDRQLVANGITTAFHGITWSWEPGLRGRESIVAIIEAIERLRDRLACDTQIHLRHEIYNVEAADEIEAWIEAGRIRLLAFNDHLPMFRRKRENPAQLSQYAERAHISLADFNELVDRVAARADAVAPTNARLAAAARSRSIALASHDDDTPAARHDYHQLGCRLCEFPKNRLTAEAARFLGDAVIMDAPNVVRGGSHAEGMSATELARAGLVDVLTSDYFYPSLPHAAFRLAAARVMPLAQAWRLVSTQPAAVAGLADRGRIAPGLRADLVLVDDRDPDLPQVVATWVEGRRVHAARAWHP
jgi:alpha-D-ribose 1-methylphosphonate 5-triphosphate diphosphatase